MSRDFPDWVNPDRAAAAGRIFHGSLPLSSMPRLDGLIVGDSGGEVTFTLSFSLTEQRQIRVDVDVEGWLPLCCQRSLETFRHELNSSAVVGIVSDEAEIAALPGEFEPLVCTDRRLKLAELVEEEVLLGLPLVPTSPKSQRIIADKGDDQGETETHRPFEVLAALKKRS
ncbi:MAG: YceD family protein [Wenzhouxiangella sp.]